MNSLKTLLRHSLDYAGMFPPATLSLEAAVTKYAECLTGPDSWILSRFVCPANQLNDLDPFMRLFRDTSSFAVSSLGVPRGVSQSGVPVTAVEAPLPPELLRRADTSAIQDVIRAVVAQMERPDVTPFFEAPAKDPWRQATAATITAIADHNGSWKAGRWRPAAFKLRTGGVTADAFPPVEQVAFVIETCLEHGVAFKCTAGLHHPVRRQDESVGTKMHGFLNVLGASVLAYAGKVKGDNLRAVLADEDPASFRFDEQGLTWRKARVSIADISSARRDLMVAFGSCSFEEPLDDLRALGLL